MSSNSGDDGAAAAVSDLSFWSNSPQVKTAEAELERRVKSLQQELKKATEQLERVRTTGVVATTELLTSSSSGSSSTHRRPSPKALSVDDNGVPLRPPEKRGYLFKWMVRLKAEQLN